MNNNNNLPGQICKPCQGGLAAMSKTQAKTMVAQLHGDWSLDNDGTQLTRSFKFKGFAKAVYQANLVAWLADQEGHHPDIKFGWGYCDVIFTTHDIGGLSENDFICATILDNLTHI